MNLCIDIGNTKVKLIVFDGEKELYYSKTEDLDQNLLSNLKHKYGIEHCILSSTRIMDKADLSFLNDHFSLLILDENTKVPIVNGYETPASLGKDRLAAAVAAAAIYPRQHCIIIDAGTCLTYNFIDDNATYQGGNIAPGLDMRLRAMHSYTDKLPLVEKNYNTTLFGKNTTTALQNGAVKGAIYELSAFIGDVFANYGDCKIILTGGDSIIFAKHLKFKIFAHPNLVLLGLNEILKFNVGLFSSIKH